MEVTVAQPTLISPGGPERVVLTMDEVLEVRRSAMPPRHHMVSLSPQM
jgi:hypothetical protein